MKPKAPFDFALAFNRYAVGALTGVAGAIVAGKTDLKEIGTIALSSFAAAVLIDLNAWSRANCPQPGEPPTP
jgi:hypothetical protein